MKTYIKWEIGSGVFIILTLVILALAKIISFAFLLGGGIFIIVLSLGIWGIIEFRKKRQIEDEEKGKVIDKETAIKIAKNKLQDTDVLEYEDEIYESDIRNEGDSNTPIYVRKSKGVFEGKIISILVNMVDRRTGIKMYDIIEKNDTDMDNDISERCNRLSINPTRHDTRTTETVNPFTNLKSIVKEVISKEKKEESEKKEGLV